MDDVLKSQFSEDFFILRRLSDIDQRFAAICADYRDAVQANRHWTLQGELNLQKGRQYEEIARELRAEIEEAIAAEKSRSR